jgi:hypothetical protein
MVGAMVVFIYDMVFNDGGHSENFRMRRFE